MNSTRPAIRPQDQRTCARAALSIACAYALTVAISCAGCVRRTISITSDPPGALVWLNDREIGRTPVDVDFTYYGEYDVRLVKDGYEPLLTSGKATAPVWDNVPLDLGAELWPGEIESRIAWHYELEPASSDPAALLERANAMRGDLPAQDSPGNEPSHGPVDEQLDPPPDHPPDDP